MVILEDSRQKVGKHKTKHYVWSKSGDHVIRCKLPFGDYCLPPIVSVDTKASLMEIASNMCGAPKEKARFREECKAAHDSGCKLYFLIESNKSGIDDLMGMTIKMGSGKFVPGDQLAIAMHTMEERYGCVFIFTTKENSANVIKEILRKGNDR